MIYETTTNTADSILCGSSYLLVLLWGDWIMKIYYSKFFQDYIFVIGGQPYLILEGVNFFSESSVFVPVDRNHLKNSRMHKREEDKEVIYICTVKD